MAVSEIGFWFLIIIQACSQEVKDICGGADPTLKATHLIPVGNITHCFFEPPLNEHIANVSSINMTAARDLCSKYDARLPQIHNQALYTAVMEYAYNFRNKTDHGYPYGTLPLGVEIKSTTGEHLSNTHVETEWDDGTQLNMSATGYFQYQDPVRGGIADTLWRDAKVGGCTFLYLFDGNLKTHCIHFYRPPENILLLCHQDPANPAHNQSAISSNTTLTMTSTTSSVFHSTAIVTATETPNDFHTVTSTNDGRLMDTSRKQDAGNGGNQLDTIGWINGFLITAMLSAI